MKKIEFSQEQIEDILNKYQNNWSQQKIADFYQVSRTVIKRILETQEKGIVIRERTSKYQYQQDIFEIIDTAEKAYWLGFLAADGCNYQREHNASIIININESFSFLYVNNYFNGKLRKSYTYPIRNPDVLKSIFSKKCCHIHYAIHHYTNVPKWILHFCILTD